MYEETLYQATAGGIPFVDILAKEGILPGVKVDQVGGISIWQKPFARPAPKKP